MKKNKKKFEESRGKFTTCLFNLSPGASVYRKLWRFSTPEM